MAEVQLHAQSKQTNRPEEKRREFQGRKLETAILKIKGSGKEFSGLVPEGAGINKRIELIAKQNGGRIKKKYHEEMGAWEITEIKIGDQLITKDKDAGIHWFIDDNKIPIAIDKKGNIKGFLNGEEARGRVISLGREDNTADPKNLKELNKVESAHAGEREKDPDLKDDILLFDKETGEITPMSEYEGAESFEWEISREKLLIQQMPAVEKTYSHSMFDGFSPEMGGGEFYYSYIEIMDSKEDIADRVIISPRIQQEFDGRPIQNEIVQKNREYNAGETNDAPSSDYKDDFLQDNAIRPVESERLPDQKHLVSGMPRVFIMERKSYGQKEFKPHGIKMERLEKRKRQPFHYPPKIGQNEERPVIMKYKIQEIPVEKEPTRQKMKYKKPNNRILKKKNNPKKRKKKKHRELLKKTKTKLKKIMNKVREILKKKKTKKIKNLNKKILIPEIKKKKRKPELKNNVKRDKKTKKHKAEIKLKPGKNIVKRKPETGKKKKKRKIRRRRAKRKNKIVNYLIIRKTRAGSSSRRRRA